MLTDQCQRFIKMQQESLFFVVAIGSSGYSSCMDISPLQEPRGMPTIFDQGELPPGPPMSKESCWVKSMQRFFPQENPDVLSKYASQLQSNMMRMLSNQINRDMKKAKETAQRMREAIQGR